MQHKCSLTHKCLKQPDSIDEIIQAIAKLGKYMAEKG